MSEMDGIIIILRSVLHTLGMIETEALGRHVTEDRASMSQWQTMGPLLDPTAYRHGQQSGSTKDAEYQLKIVEQLLEVRKTMDEREAFCKQYRKEGND